MSIGVLTDWYAGDMLDLNSKWTAFISLLCDQRPHKTLYNIAWHSPINAYNSHTDSGISQAKATATSSGTGLLAQGHLDTQLLGAGD